jgi:hypothetical protein
MSAEIVELAAERQKRRDEFVERFLDSVIPDHRLARTERQKQILAVLRDALSRATPRKPRGGR